MSAGAAAPRAHGAPARTARKSALRRRWPTSRIVAQVLVILGAIIVLIPFVWMLRTALMSLADIFAIPVKVLPTEVMWENFAGAWEKGNIGLYTINSLLVAGLATLGTVVSSSLAAYGFAFLKSKWRDRLFYLVLSGLLIPGVVTLVPSYMIFRQIGWLNTWLPLIVPFWFGISAFSIFLLRQFYRTIPRELREAAKIDGANEFFIYLRVIFPLAGPAHAAVAIFAFLFSWNDLFSPLIYINSEERQLLPIGLASFPNPQGVTEWNLLMAAALMAMVPCLLLFFFFQRYFIQGIVTSGLRG